jgi:tripartite-type tricarboxylate transporter receptor subunit TctC
MEKTMRLRVLLLAILSLLGVAWSAGASADDYPSRPITLVAPYSAGSGIDVLARLIANKLGPRLGQPVIVEDKPGAGSSIGSNFVARAAPDGYTLMLTSNPLTVLPALLKSLPFDPVTSFIHITEVCTGSMALVVNPKAMPVNSVEELVAKIKANPGKYNYGSAGIGTPHHLGMELFKKQFGLNIVHVPYRGSTGAMNDLLAGQVPVAMFPVNVVLPHVKDGKLRVLAVSGKGRSVLAPNTPTFQEAGLTNVDIPLYYLISGPAKLPAPIVKKLNTEFGAVLNDPDIRKQLLALGLVAQPSTPEAITALVKSETARWKSFLKEVHIEPK